MTNHEEIYLLFVHLFFVVPVCMQCLTKYPASLLDILPMKIQRLEKLIGGFSPTNLRRGRGTKVGTKSKFSFECKRLYMSAYQLQVFSLVNTDLKIR